MRLSLAYTCHILPTVSLSGRVTDTTAMRNAWESRILVTAKVAVHTKK